MTIYTLCTAPSDIGKLAGKLGYQMTGTAGSSIGNNWARGEDPFSLYPHEWINLS